MTGCLPLYLLINPTGGEGLPLPGLVLLLGADPDIGDFRHFLKSSIVKIGFGFGLQNVKKGGKQLYFYCFPPFLLCKAGVYPKMAQATSRLRNQNSVAAQRTGAMGVS